MVNNGTIIALNERSQVQRTWPQTKQAKLWLPLSEDLRNVWPHFQGSVLIWQNHKVHLGMTTRLDQSFRNGHFLTKPTKDSYCYDLSRFFFSFQFTEQQKKSSSQSICYLVHMQPFLLDASKWRVKLKLKICLRNMISDQKELVGGFSAHLHCGDRLVKYTCCLGFGVIA